MRTGGETAKLDDQLAALSVDRITVMFTRGPAESGWEKYTLPPTPSIDPWQPAPAQESLSAGSAVAGPRVVPPSCESE